MKVLFRFILCYTVFIGTLCAQYRTESWDFLSGWNSIYLNIDTGDESLDSLLAGDLDITEIWQWRPGGLDPTLEEPVEQMNGEYGAGVIPPIARFPSSPPTRLTIS